MYGVLEAVHEPDSNLPAVEAIVRITNKSLSEPKMSFFSFKVYELPDLIGTGQRSVFLLATGNLPNAMMGEKSYMTQAKSFWLNTFLATDVAYENTLPYMSTSVVILIGVVRRFGTNARDAAGDNDFSTKNSTMASLIRCCFSWMVFSSTADCGRTYQA